MFNVIALVPNTSGIKVTPEPLPFWDAIRVCFPTGHGYVYRRKLVVA